MGKNECRPSGPQALLSPVTKFLPSSKEHSIYVWVCIDLTRKYLKRLLKLHKATLNFFKLGLNCCSISIPYSPIKAQTNGAGWKPPSFTWSSEPWWESLQLDTQRRMEMGFKKQTGTQEFLLWLSRNESN